MSQPKHNPTKPKPKGESTPRTPGEDKRIRQQRLLHAVKRLKANEDFQLVFLPRLEAGEQAAISKFLDPDISDAELRRAQARFIAVRHLGRLLDDLEESLTAAVDHHPTEEKREARSAQPPPDTADTALLRGAAGGWFDTVSQETGETSAENT